MKTATFPLCRVGGFFCLLALSTAGVSPGLGAVMWDLTKEWSDAANPNGPWKYREGTNLLPSVTVWEPGGGWTVPQPGWAIAGSGNRRVPFMYRTNGTETFPSDALAGDVIVHTTDEASGQGNGDSNIVWTSPTAGVVSILGGVWMTRDIGRSNDWKLSLNGTLLSQGNIGSGDAYNRSNRFLFSNGTGGATAVQNITVAVGDAIRLDLVRTSAPGDFVGVDFRIVAGHVWNTGTGANGHIYIPVEAPDGITWSEAEAAAVAAGGHLASIDYAEENAFVYGLVSATPAYWRQDSAGKTVGPWLGGVQLPVGTEPDGGWQWTGGYGLGFTAWAAGQPDDGHGGTENRLAFFHATAATGSNWADYPAEPGSADRPHGYIIEIDPSGNTGGSTVWANGPGANGHRYEAVLVSGGIMWAEAEAAAIAKGGHLASIESAEENAFVYSLVSEKGEFWFQNNSGDGIGPWVGGYQPDGSPEPGGGWQWTDGVPFGYTNWEGGEPNDYNGGEKCLHLFNGEGGRANRWNDLPANGLTRGYIAEYAGTPGTTGGALFADRLYVASQTRNTVFQYRIAPGGAPALLRSLTEGMNKPSGLAYSPDRELLVMQRGDLNAGNARLSRFTNVTTQPVSTGDYAAVTPPLDFTHGGAFRGAELLVTDPGHNSVRRFHIQGGSLVEILPAITAGLSGNLIRYVAVHPWTQEIFVSHAGGPNKVLRYTVAGDGSVSSHGEIAGNGIANPHAMVFSPWGEFFVTNYDGGTVSRFLLDSNGVAIPNGTIAGNGLSQPASADFSPWGELFVGNSNADSISRFRFDAAGAAVANGTFSTPGPPSALQFVAASAPTVPEPCVPGVTTSVSDGLIGWWKGDGNAADFTGNNPGTEEYGVTYEPGRFGQAFRVGKLPLGYDGSPRVNLGHIPKLKGASAHTFCAWVKVDKVDGNAQVAIGLPVGNIPPPPPPVLPPGVVMSGLYPSNARGFFCNGLSSTFAANFISLNNVLSYSGRSYAETFGAWHHLAMTWRSSDGQIAFYVDGVLKTGGNAPAGVKFPDGIADLAPGYIGAGAFCKEAIAVTLQSSPCLIDDVRLYTRDLSEAEIQLIASGNDFNTCPPPDTGLPPLFAGKVPAGVRVWWPSRFTGWTLETSPDFHSWTPFVGTPALETDDFAVTEGTTPLKRYFRLRRTDR